MSGVGGLRAELDRSPAVLEEGAGRAEEEAEAIVILPEKQRKTNRTEEKSTFRHVQSNQPATESCLTRSNRSALGPSGVCLGGHDDGDRDGTQQKSGCQTNCSDPEVASAEFWSWCLSLMISRLEAHKLVRFSDGDFVSAHVSAHVQ